MKACGITTPRVALVSICLVPFTTAQSIPGASYFIGNGNPGAGSYQLIDDYEPAIFFNKFNFYSSYDPTYGHVQYVNQSVATANGFVSTTSSNTAKIGVDTTNKWPRGGPGRPSVRVISDNTYMHGLFILDAVHMPWGCGTWPAYWLLGPNWPNTGEIDIIEGVNTNTQDSISLHSSPNCTIAGSGQTGTLQTTNCDVNANGNSGCGSTLSNTTIPNNYGNGFNTNQGGVYATEWTGAYIKTWFFPRSNIPASITNGNPDPSTFGTPAVNQQGSCNIDQHFSNMSIIINIDFCGDWAGQVYSQYTDCPQNASAGNSLNSCVDFVGNNPSYFTNAYWEIHSIKVYQMPLAAQPSSSYSTSLSSVAPQSSATSNSIAFGMGVSSTSVSSAPYTGPISSVTTTTAPAASTPAICPTSNNTVWTDNNGARYTINCGSDYNGAGTGLPGNGIYSATSFENCLEICDGTSGCLAVAFVGGNGAGTCYAKSTHGALISSGGVNAAVKVSSGASTSVSVQIPSPSSPVCPNDAGSTYIDTQSISYGIICYTDYTGNNIGTPITQSSLAACLPACDSMNGCAGVVFNPYYDQCQLKSSFAGSQTGNNSVIAARRNAANAASASSSSATSTSTFEYGYGNNHGYGSQDYGYLGGSSSPSTSTSSTKASIVSSITSTTSLSQTSSSAFSSPTIVSTSVSTASGFPFQSSTSTPTISVSSSFPSTNSGAVSTSSTSTIMTSTSTSMTSTSPTSSTAANPATTSVTVSSSQFVSSTGTMSGSSSLSSSVSLMSSKVSTTSLTSTSSQQSSSISSSGTSASTTSGPTSGPSNLPSSLSTLLSVSSEAAVSVSSSSTLSSSVTQSSSTTNLATSYSAPVTNGTSQQPTSSTSSAVTSATPCPTSSTGYCQSTAQQQTCADKNGAVYSVTCGMVFSGAIIDTSSIYGGGGYKLFVRAREPDIASCQGLCDNTNGCIAFNYITGNCVLLATITGSFQTANAIGGTLVRAAPSIGSTTSTGPPGYGSTSGGISATFPPTESSSLGLYGSPSISTSIPTSVTSGSSSGLMSSTASSSTTVSSSSALILTVTTTVTTSIPSGGYYTSGASGSFYVYSSGISPSGSASLCFTCSLTPTVVTTGTGQSQSTCSAASFGTTTVYTTSTVTSCPPQPTCPASGFLIIGGSQSYPGQQIVTTTDSSGMPLTYTQIPKSQSSYSVSTVTVAAGSPSSSSVTMGNTTLPACPGSDGKVYTDNMGMQYQIHCGTLFTDATLDTQTQNTLVGCMSACDMYNVLTFYLGSQCLGVSWYEQLTTNNCLLKGGSTPTALRACDSCALLTGKGAPGNNTYGNGNGGGGSSTITYTTVVGGSASISTFTITVPASTVTIYTTIYTDGGTTSTAISTTTIPASTFVETTTTTVGGSTVVTQRQAGPGYYGGGGGTGGGGGGGTGGHGGGGGYGYGYGPGYSGNPPTVYISGPTQTTTTTTTSTSISLVPTTIITTVSQGYTTTIVTYVPAGGGGGYYGGGGGCGGGGGPASTVTTTTTSTSLSVTSVLTTIITTVSQGYTTTIITYVPKTYTIGGGSGGSGGGGGGGGTVTVTEGTVQPTTTVYITVTVTTTVLPVSSSSSFTCRTYSTNYLNGLHGRSEPTSAPMARNGVVLDAVPPPPSATIKRSIFEKQVVLAQMARMVELRGPPSGILSGEFDLWFIE